MSLNSVANFGVDSAAHQAEAFDRLCDIVAQEIVQRFVEELEKSDGKQAGEVPA